MTGSGTGSFGLIREAIATVGTAANPVVRKVRRDELFDISIFFLQIFDAYCNYIHL